jgi:hypothetical protein
MGLDLLINYNVENVRPQLGQFLDATTRILLLHVTSLDEYLDELAVAEGFTPISWYVKPWHGPKRLGKAPRKERGGWFKAEDGRRSFEQLLNVLEHKPKEWRSRVRSKHPTFATDDELRMLLADVRAFRECLAGAERVGAGFYLFMI